MTSLLNRLRSLRPNRVAAVLGTVAALAGALAPAVANLDLSSTVGVVSGVAAIAGIVIKFLHGSQLDETRRASLHMYPDAPNV